MTKEEQQKQIMQIGPDVLESIIQSVLSRVNHDKPSKETIAKFVEITDKMKDIETMVARTNGHIADHIYAKDEILEKNTEMTEDTKKKMDKLDLVLFGDKKLGIKGMLEKSDEMYEYIVTGKKSVFLAKVLGGSTIFIGAVWASLKVFPDIARAFVHVFK